MRFTPYRHCLTCDHYKATPTDFCKIMLKNELPSSCEHWKICPILLQFIIDDKEYGLQVIVNAIIDTKAYLKEASE